MPCPSPVPSSSVRPPGPRPLVALLVVVLVGVLVLTGSGARAEEVQSGAGQWPLSPRPTVVVGFDPPDAPWDAGHRGVDLAGRPAQSVLAALPGRVSFAGRIAGRGVLVVDHGATRTTYEPVAAAVQVGDLVDARATIGHLELFGSHCFPAWCLHWGLVEGRDGYLDPLRLVGAAPVILLPLHSVVGRDARPGTMAPYPVSGGPADVAPVDVGPADIGLSPAGLGPVQPTLIRLSPAGIGSTGFGPTPLESAARLVPAP